MMIACVACEILLLDNGVVERIEVVNPYDTSVFSQQLIHQIAADKSRCSSDQSCPHTVTRSYMDRKRESKLAHVPCE
jgi:hypothetical protein